MPKEPAHFWFSWICFGELKSGILAVRVGCCFGFHCGFHQVLALCTCPGLDQRPAGAQRVALALSAERRDSDRQLKALSGAGAERRR